MNLSGLPTSISAIFNPPQATPFAPQKVTPLPQPVVSPTTPSAGSTTPVPAGSSVSAFSLNVQLLQISISKESNGNAQVNVVKQELRLFRAEVKGAVKDAVSELNDDTKQSVKQLLKQFSRDLRPRRRDDGDRDENENRARNSSLERGTGNTAATSSLLTTAQSAVEGLIGGLQQALQGDDLQQVVAKLQDLFKGFSDRLQPVTTPNPTPVSEPAENQAAGREDGDRSNGNGNPSTAVSFSLTALSVQASYQRVSSL